MTTTFAFNPFTSNFDLVTTGLTPSEITGGTANSVAGFDSSGALESIPGWGIDTINGGLNLSLSLTPAANPNQTDVINAVQTVITPSIDLTQYNFIGLQNSTRLAGPHNLAIVTGLNNTLAYDDAGAINLISLDNQSLVLGDGTNANASTSAIMNSGTVTIRDQHTANNVQMVNNVLNADAGSSVVSITGFNQNLNLSSAPSNSTIGAALNLNTTVPLTNGYSGLSQTIQLADNIQFVNGNNFGLNVNGGTVANGVLAFTDGTSVQSGATVNGLQSFIAGPNLQAGSTVNGYTGLNINPTIAGSLSTFQYSGALASGQLSGTMSNAAGFTVGMNLASGTTLSNNYYGLNDVSNVRSGASLNTYYGLSSTPQLHSGSAVTNFTGLTLSPTLDTNVGAVTLAQLAPGGSGTATNVTGLSINLSSIASTGRKLGLNVNDGSINVNTSITTASSSGVDAANSIIPQLTIPNGSPITGTTVFGLNGAMLVDAQDNFGAGALGPSAISIAFVGVANVASGKTVAGLSMAGAGTQVSGAGTVTDLIGFHAIGSIPTGGTPTVTNQYMFKGASIAPGLPTNSWGVHIAETSAENFLGRLAVNTASQKNTASKQFDVLGDSKLDGALQVTDLTAGVVLSDASGNLSNVAVLPETKGGTNQSTYTTGDTLYASASNTLSKLPIGSSGDVLTVSGGVPTWAPPATGTTNYAVYQYSSQAGYGSTGDAVVYYNNTVRNTDASSLLTIANSSVNGLSITANRRCDITITAAYTFTGPDNGGITKNVSSTSTVLTSCADSEIVAIGTSAGNQELVSITVRDVADISDVYRPQTDKGPTGANSDAARIFITAREF